MTSDRVGWAWIAAPVHVAAAAVISATGIGLVGLIAYRQWFVAGRGWAAVTMLVGLALIGVAVAGADVVVGPARFDPAIRPCSGFAVGVAGAVLAVPLMALAGDRLHWVDPRAAALGVIAGGLPSVLLNALRWHGVRRRRGRDQSLPPPPSPPEL
ncbi:hypothetical protein ACFO1B_00310 [Dactylosporangium siamense]|uniref:Uncharacterized protein n=1 Tax=Dactylosporangium siamense TaxID=685454 RepID=A0A919PCG4_9ACTN|nr:hypothetical protein [Dactylosporangium siamense]GIG42210.1 hypothetical protein Dsi01nite_002510 [Dactylosporangium siamense]